MNDLIIRASLDQALLAIAAIENGEYDKARAHTELAAALGGMPPADQRGPRQQSFGVVAAQWRSDIAAFEPESWSGPPVEVVQRRS